MTKNTDPKPGVGRIKHMVILGGESAYPARDRGVPLVPPKVHDGQFGGVPVTGKILKYEIREVMMARLGLAEK